MRTVMIEWLLNSDFERVRFSRFLGNRPLQTGSLFCLTAVFFCFSVAAAEFDQAEFFRDKVEPVLKEHCYACHSEKTEKPQGNLRLDSRSAMLQGGDSGPAVVFGQSHSSLLMQAVRHEGGMQMPPKSPKLTDAAVADLAKWIDSAPPDPSVVAETRIGPYDIATARQHWAFQPIHKPNPPQTPHVIAAESPVDAFILAELEVRRWQQAPPASREELIRRVSFDLIGLPPTPAEVAAFVNDRSPDAYPQLVERLLSSRHYGERWAQHWLDVIRYAETEGYEYDRHVPDAWRFRDYVIDSLNADKPFDRFLSEQLAGDEIDPDNPECLVASIFHRLGPVRRNAGNSDIALSRNEVLTERTDIIGSTFLGLTIGCARCHNHKLEPIAQKDYYRLQAYLAATDEHNIILAPAEERANWEAKTKAIKGEIDAIKAKSAKATGNEKTQFDDQAKVLETSLPADLPVIPSTRNDWEKRTPIHVLRRGVWENKGELVQPRPLSVLVSQSLPELNAASTSPRTELARWLTSPDHPLTARVLVNRLWQFHFGMGLVKTANDFGMKGARPSHPELLDWLAATLIEEGWHLKPIHRLIVLSKTYQQSSRMPAPPNESTDADAAHRLAEQQTNDPENRLLWHFTRRRLTAEEVRDAMLFASGRLNTKPAGPSVIVPVDPELVQLLYKPDQWAVTKDPRQHDRRSIYLLAKRNLRLPFLENLDAPALQTSCARRESSTHAPQALELLNGRLSNDLAGSFAQKLSLEAAGDPKRLVALAFEWTLGRSPSPAELAKSLDFVREQPLSELTLALFNLNEFAYVP